MLLIAELTFTPLNLWTGRTMANFERYTGLPPRVGTQIVAPLKLLAAVTLAIGLAVPLIGLAGAALAAAVCAFYLVRLLARSRRHLDGITAFALFGSWAVALLVLRLLT